jgi:hypothetical protein
VFTLVALVALPVAGALAQEEHGGGHDTGGDAARALFLRDFENLESKFLDLADAMSADQYAWRPMEGVRSVSEVFMLIVAENLVIPSTWGAAAPEGVTVNNQLFGSLSEITDKEQVLENLRGSFAYYKNAIAELPSDKMHSSIQFFGQERTVHDALYLIAGDMHEHLGQAIAYARMNQVVPPWTARAQQND